jgi:LuxR family maltose regulon positive regulatory protein
MLARFLIAQERLAEATTLLLRLQETTEARRRISRVIEVLILQALAAQAGGDTVRAMTKLEQALTLAEPEGFVRIFVDEGPPMAQLLHEALNQGIAPDYVRRLQAASSSQQPVQADTTSSQSDQSELVEPLSEREIEVLQLIAEGLTNQEIASRLFLSQNTIKVHTRNIYGKLNAHSRTQATLRSRELGILPRS